VIYRSHSDHKQYNSHQKAVFQCIMPSLLFKFLVAVLACLSTTVLAACPYSRDQINEVDLSGVKKCKFDSANAKRCETCGCGLFETILPLLGGEIDCDDGGEGVLKTVISCQALLVPKIADSLDVRILGLARALGGPKQCVEEGMVPPTCLIEAVEAACPEDSAAVRGVRGAIYMELFRLNLVLITYFLTILCNRN